ncbi:MAG: hypothetical protein FWD33_03040 [Alphaproteobacteria bacterium]|nr:hypothetical protein [Alphaproteobacteria bacterium]
MHKFRFQIAFADTDAGGIVYHARHIEICERARMNMMNGWDYNRDGGFVLRGLAAEYKNPILLGELVDIETEFIEVGNASCKARQTLKVGDEVRSVITVDVVFVNAMLRPIRLTDQLVEFLKQKGIKL